MAALIAAMVHPDHLDRPVRMDPVVPKAVVDRLVAGIAATDHQVLQVRLVRRAERGSGRRKRADLLVATVQVVQADLRAVTVQVDPVVHQAAMVQVDQADLQAATVPAGLLAE